MHCLELGFDGTDTPQGYWGGIGTTARQTARKLVIGDASIRRIGISETFVDIRG